MGDAMERPIDVRIISATHKNLLEMMAAGQFREDFYYRINVILILAPPLRQRKSDIPLLAHYLIGKLARDNQTTLPALHEDALEALENYPYPGNVSELENILERAMALNENNIITRVNIAGENINPPGINAASADSALSGSDLPIDEHVSQIESERIRRALQNSNGNITAAANALRTSFRSLRYRGLKSCKFNGPDRRFCSLRISP